MEIENVYLNKKIKISSPESAFNFSLSSIMGSNIKNNNNKYENFRISHKDSFYFNEFENLEKSIKIEENVSNNYITDFNSKQLNNNN